MAKDYHPLDRELVLALGADGVKLFFDKVREHLPHVTFICHALDCAGPSDQHFLTLVSNFKQEIEDSLVHEGAHLAYGGWCYHQDPEAPLLPCVDLLRGRLQWLDRLEHYVAHGGEFPQPQLPE